MPLTDEIVPFHIRLLPGQDTKKRDTLLEETNVETAENLRYDPEVGSVTKRERLAYYNSTSLGTDSMTSLERYYASDTTKYLLGAYSSTMKVGNDSAGTFSNIQTGLTSGKRFSFVTYNGLCIYGNGYDNTMQTDGTVSWELGACKASENTGTVVEDCEDAWNEQVIANVTAATDTGLVGTYCAKFTITNTFATGIVGSEAIAATDLSKEDSIHMWVKSSVDFASGVLKFCVDEHANLASSRDFDVGALAAGVWTDVSIDTTTITEAAVISIGFKINSDPFLHGEANIILYVDSVRSSNLKSGGAYYYAVTFDSSTVISGAVSNTLTTHTEHPGITLNNIPLGPVGTVNRRIYRTEAAGSTLKLCYTISDNTTTSYADHVSDAELGATMGAVTDAIPKGCYLKLYRERLLIAGDPTQPNRIWYSNAFLPHYIQKDSNDDWLDIAPNDGDVIVGIPILLGTICVFKRNNIRKLHIDSSDVDSWFVDDPISFQGSPAPWSIAQTPYGIAYQGWDHLYSFDGSVSRPIIDDFDIAEISPPSLSQSVGFWHENAYLLSYISLVGSVDYHDKLLRFEWLRNSASIDTISVSCFTAFKGDSESGALYYGASDAGYVYMAENQLKSQVLNTMTQLNGNATYPATIYSGLDDIEFEGSEDAPEIKIGWDTTIDSVPGTFDGEQLSNKAMETWTAGAAAAPDDWTLNGAAATIAREGTIIHGGTYSAKLTRAGTNCSLTQDAGSPTFWSGKNITLTAWVYATQPNCAYLQINDGVGATNSSYHTGGSTWEQLTVTRKLDYSSGQVLAVLGIVTTDTSVYFDDCTFNFTYPPTYDQPDIEGIYTSEVFTINAGTMGSIYWNEQLISGGDVLFSTRTGATSAACLAASWDGSLTAPGGSTITSTANIYFQFKATLSSADTSDSPRIVTLDDYTIKFTYYPGGTYVIGNVNFRYGTGYRNFGQPQVDKIFKKIVCVHEGVGTYTIDWATDSGESGSWTVNMTTYPRVFEAFFPSNAYGRKVKFTVSKYDTDDFVLKELMGLWTPRPLII